MLTHALAPQHVRARITQELLLAMVARLHQGEPPQLIAMLIKSSFGADSPWVRKVLNEAGVPLDPSSSFPSAAALGNTRDERPLVIAEGCSIFFQHCVVFSFCFLGIANVCIERQEKECALSSQTYRQSKSDAERRKRVRQKVKEKVRESPS
jgi:hypothetical protein